MSRLRSSARARSLRIGVDTGGTFTDFHVVGPFGSAVFKIPSTPEDPSVAVLQGLERVLDWVGSAASSGESATAPGMQETRRLVARIGSRDGRGRRTAPSGSPLVQGGDRRGFDPGVALIHGTTVGTNALITRRLARTAFVTTAGFEDLVEIGRQNRESLYDLSADRPPPIVPRSLRLGVQERVHLLLREGPAPPHVADSPPWIAARHGADRYGAIAGSPSRDAPSLRRGALPSRGSRPTRTGPGRELDRDQGGLRTRRTAPVRREVERLHARLRALRVEAVAIGFLHSYLDPSHEELVGRALGRLGVPVTLSHRISGEFREYERFSTAIANAALQPPVGRYLASLESRVGGMRVSILQSDGTTATAKAAAVEPVRTVLSGPAGGALAALALARRIGDRRVLSFDMGGTSTDAVLIDGGLPRLALGRIAGIPIRSPMIEVRTVGAGGGSIARRDKAGALRVGPDSAGADPGPACYGRSLVPTVTDAHIVLGRLGAHDLLGGEFPIDAARSTRALARLARELGMDPGRAAEGVLEVVEATMERALRGISIERGKDPRRYALYAFGGAGGLHACALAERLGIRRIVIPPGPGVFSATGLSRAEPGVEVAASLFASTRDTGNLIRAFRALEARAHRRLREQGVGSAGVRTLRLADLRYAGQSHEITLPFGRGMDRAFRRAHQERYGHVRENAAIEVVTIRVRAIRPARADPALRPATRTATAIAVSSSPRIAGKGGSARIRFRSRWVSSLVIPRDEIGRKDIVRGPARVTEYSATTVVAPGWEARRGPGETLVLTPSRTSRRARSRNRAPGPSRAASVLGARSGSLSVARS